MKMEFYNKDNLTGVIEIKVFETQTAKTFVDVISKTNKTSSTTNHSISRNKIEIINDFLRMKEVVKQYNDTSYDRKIDVDLEKDFSLHKLFDLHEHFEYLGERKRSNDPTLNIKAYNEVINIGCELNGLIHKLEGNLYGGQWLQALYKKPDIVRIPLTEEIISEAVSGYRKDVLYVGYGETGKNMAHIFQMNEHELLERKMVQPQRYILSEFFLPFNDMPLDYEGYKKWCIKHNAAEKGYDYENPIWYGKWEVGQIVKKSFNNLSSFPQYDTIRFVI
jgi:hypothetical protein